MGRWEGGREGVGEKERERENRETETERQRRRDRGREHLLREAFTVPRSTLISKAGSHISVHQILETL